MYDITEREGKLDRLFYSDKLKEFLKESIKIEENANINKLLESSQFFFFFIFAPISDTYIIEERNSI